MAIQLSASAHLAQFGFTTKQANDWIVANIGSPKTIIDVCQQVGITRAMLSEITGYGVDLITSFFNLFNLDATKLDSIQSASTKIDVNLFSQVQSYPGNVTFDAGTNSYNFIIDFDKTYNTKVKYGGAEFTVSGLNDRIINYGSDDSITLLNYKKINNVLISDWSVITSTFILNPENSSDQKNSTYIYSEAKNNSGSGAVILVGVHTQTSKLWEYGSKGAGIFNALSVGDITFG